MLAAMTLDFGQRIKIVDSVTALDTDFYVVGMDHRYDAGHLRVNLSLDLANTENYWNLGIAGKGELGTKTWLAY